MDCVQTEVAKTGGWSSYHLRLLAFWQHVGSVTMVLRELSYKFRDVEIMSEDDPWVNLRILCVTVFVSCISPQMGKKKKNYILLLYKGLCDLFLMTIQHFFPPIVITVMQKFLSHYCNVEKLYTIIYVVTFILM